MPDLKIDVKVNDQEARQRLESLYGLAQTNATRLTREQMASAFSLEKAQVQVNRATTDGTKAVTEQVRISRQALAATRDQERAAKELEKARRADERAVRDANRAEEQLARQRAAAARQAEREYDDMARAAEKSFAQQAAAAQKAFKESQRGANGGSVALPRTFAGFTPAGTAQAVLGGLGFAGAQQVVSGTVDFLRESKDAFRDYVEQVNKSGEVFKEAKAAVLDWSRSSAQSLAMSRTAALQATSDFGNLFNTLGIGRQKTAEMSEKMVQLAADLASFHNIKPEEAFEKLKAGLVGEIRPLRDLGVQLDETTLKERAMQMGLIKTTHEILPPQIKTMAAYEEILKQTKDAQGDFARTSGEVANSERILNAEIENMKTDIGEEILPIWKEWLKTILDVTRAIKDLPGAWSENTQQSMRERAEAAAKPVSDSDMLAIRQKEARRATLLARYQYSEQTRGALIEPKNAEEVEFLKSAGITFDEQGRARPGTDVSGALASTFKTMGAAARLDTKRFQPQVSQGPATPSWKIASELREEESSAKKRLEYIVGRFGQAQSIAQLNQLRKQALNLLEQCSDADRGDLSQRITDRYGDKLRALQSKAERQAEKRQSLSEDVTERAGKGVESLTEAVTKAKADYVETGRTRILRGLGVFGGGVTGTQENLTEVVRAVQEDAIYQEDLRQQKNEQRLEELRKSYAYVIDFLEDEQRGLHDAIQQAIDRGDVTTAKNYFQALTDNRARAAGFAYSQSLAESQPQNVFDIIGNRVGAAPYIAQQIQQFQAETAPIQQQIRSMQIASDLRQADYTNRNASKLGNFVSGFGANSAELIGSAIAEGINSGNSRAAFQNLGRSLATTFVNTMVSETLTKPLVGLFQKLGGEIAQGGREAGASIYQAVGALYGLFATTQRKKKTGIGSVLGGIGGFLLGGPAGAVAGYNVGNAVDNGDYLGAAIGAGTGYASGAFANGPTFGTKDYGQVGGRSVQITNNYGVVNDRADANRIMDHQTNLLQKATVAKD